MSPKIPARAESYYPGPYPGAMQINQTKIATEGLFQGSKKSDGNCQKNRTIREITNPRFEIRKRFIQNSTTR